MGFYSLNMVISGVILLNNSPQYVQVMGLGNGVHWCAWFCQSLLVYTVCVILLVLLLYIGRIMLYTNMFLFALIMMLYVCASITQVCTTMRKSCNIAYP